jgi:hypothetical protein
VRSRTFRAVALFVAVTLTIPAFARTKTFIERMKKAAIGSVTSLGVETAIKLAGGILYNTVCDPPSDDKTAKFLCDVLGSVTGKSEEKWKEEVDKQLKDIKAATDELTKGQAELKRSIATIDTTLNYEFDNIAPKTESFKIITTIDALWTRYSRLVNKVSQATTDAKREELKGELLDFANDVVRQNLHGEMARLNTVITTPIGDAQSVTAYPYVKWQKQHPGLHHYNFDPSKMYDVAEKKFMDLRMYQEKGYLIYLFAAEILESRCEKEKAQCTRPPISSRSFNENYQEDLRQQLKSYNEALDWFILAYSAPHYNDADLMLPEGSRDTIDRANLFTAALLGPADGMWARVYSMGDQWDRTVRFNCDGGQSYDAKPFFDYTIPIKDEGSLDWWTSSQKNGVYDEVRFAKEWRGTMYRIPAKNVGPCVMSNTAPAFMPYTDRETAIMDLVIKGTTTKIGSAFAVQRAGGSYALTSGEWAMEKQPQFKYEGGAKQVQSRYDWTIEKGKYGVPFVSLMYDGKGAWQSFDDTHLHQRNVTHIYRRTPVKSPEGGTFKLVMVQSTDCAKVCRNNRGDEHVVMEYNIEAPKKDKAKLEAITGIYFYSVYGNANNDSFNDLRDRMANGIRIDGSFGETNDRKEKKVEGDQTGTVTLQARQAYYLQDLAYWELWDATVGLDAVYYWYRSKITPVAVYLTK